MKNISRDYIIYQFLTLVRLKECINYEKMERNGT